MFFETYCRECTSGNVVETELEKGRDIQLLVDDDRVEGDGNKHRDKLKWLRDGERFVAGMREPEIFNGWSVFYLEDGTKE